MNGRQKARRQIRFQRSSKTGTQYQYFDYGLMAVLLFLVCFGLVMLYSTSSYDAQVNMGGDAAFYFKRQILFSSVSLVGMYFVTKIDYHIYAKFADRKSVV